MATADGWRRGLRRDAISPASYPPFGGGEPGYSHNFDTGSAAGAAGVEGYLAVPSGGTAQHTFIAGEMAIC